MAHRFKLIRILLRAVHGTRLLSHISLFSLFSRISRISLITLVGLAQPGWASSMAVVVIDDLGIEHRFESPPQRIITLLPSLTESLAILGGESRIVGVDRYSNWPASLAGLPRLGGLEDALIEAIAKLQPDVVLASTSARSLERLQALGFKVVRLRSDTHADIQRTLWILSQLLGTPHEGPRVWAQLQQQMAAASQRVPASLRGQRVYFEVDGGPYAAGRGSFIGETLWALGMDNIVPLSFGPFPKLNPEFVVRAQPDVVMGEASLQTAMNARPGWASIPALVKQQVCGFEAAHYEIMIRPGPRLGEAAAIMAECLISLARQ